MLAVIMLALSVPVLPARAVCVPPPETVAQMPAARALDDMLRRATVFGFSGQVLVERNGQVLLHRAYGFADRAAARPFDLYTPVGAASMTKQFTAAAILLLQQQGRLQVTDPVGRFIPEAPAGQRDLTIHQLLTHTSGLGAGDVLADFDGSHAELLEQIFARPLRGKPGERVRYSNAGYSLLATIVERASGRAYPDFLQAALFAPAGMTRTGIIGTPTAPSGGAHAYAGWRDHGSVSDWPRNWRALGGGDMMTTAGDLYCWAKTMREGSLLTRESRALQTTAHIGPADDAWGYGMMTLRTPAGHVTWEHGGDTELGNNGLFREFADSTLVTITSNGKALQTNWYRWAVQNRIEALLFDRSTPAIPEARAASAAERLDLAGTYTLDDSSRLHIIDDGAYLWLAPDGQAAVDLLSSSAAGEPGTRASAKTEALLARLRARHPDPWTEALGPADAATAGEWQASWTRDLTSKYGALLGYAVRGTFLDARGPAVTVVSCRFNGADVPLWFLWRDGGDGPLAGLDERSGPYPRLFVAALQGGALVAHDLFSDRTRVLRITRTPGGDRALVPNGAGVWIKRPFVGWSR